MVFSSIVFIFYFLPLFLIAYYFSGLRSGAIVVGSAVFYTWGEGLYLLLLAALIVLNYGLALRIERSRGSRAVLVFAVALNVLVLAIFKYAGFLLGIWSEITRSPAPQVHIHLPLGISFFTFQLISYLVDVSRREIGADRNLIRFAAYIMMFPHLIAGPIVRYADIDRDMFKRDFSLENAGLGAQFFIVGLCQKMLIANTVASVADAAFALPLHDLSGLAAYLGVLSYSLQIYFDFCGYSNMAIGLAFLLGLRFPINFDYPYSSRSITEFWRRWHMSLSFWFRDYVYIPLGGNRCGPWRTLRNLLIVFALTGLWHGAAWTFVLWGLFHGAFLIVERVGWGRVLARLPSIAQRFYALAVVMLGWLLFRADGLQQVKAFGSAMLGLSTPQAPPLLRLWLGPEVVAAMVAGSVLSFPLLPRLLNALNRPVFAGPVIPGTHHGAVVQTPAIPITALVLGLALCLLLLVSSSLNPFLYFRF
jgi:alginate O-acetyltransferase complex protein AlgI